MVRVMIFDDKEDLVFTTEDSLKVIDEDYVFSHSNNGEDCVSKVKKFKPDIILMDLMMPKMNGVQASKKLKTDKDTKDIPILFLTASTDPESHSLAEEISQDIIEKPFDPKKLDKKIKQLIKKKK